MFDPPRTFDELCQDADWPLSRLYHQHSKLSGHKLLEFQERIATFSQDAEAVRESSRACKRYPTRPSISLPRAKRRFGGRRLFDMGLAFAATTRIAFNCADTLGRPQAVGCLSRLFRVSSCIFWRSVLGSAIIFPLAVIRDRLALGSLKCSRRRFRYGLLCYRVAFGAVDDCQLHPFCSPIEMEESWTTGSHATGRHRRRGGTSHRIHGVFDAAVNEDGGRDDRVAEA